MTRTDTLDRVETALLNLTDEQYGQYFLLRKDGKSALKALTMIGALD